jgi:hypothetical protein
VGGGGGVAVGACVGDDVGRRTAVAVGEATSCGQAQEAVRKGTTTRRRMKFFILIILLLFEEGRGKEDSRFQIISTKP